MLSTRAIEEGWLRESSESAAAEAEEAPGSTTTSSMASKGTEDNCSPEKTSSLTYCAGGEVRTAIMAPP